MTFERIVVSEEEKREAVAAVRAREDELDARELAELDDNEDGDVLRGIDEVRSVEGVQFQVVRVLPADTAGFCRSYNSAEFSLDRVALDYGGGKYRVRIKGPKGFLKGGGSVTIAPPSANAVARAQTGGASAPPVAGSWQEFEQREEARRERARRERNEMIALIGPIAAPIIASLIGNRGPDLAALITAFKPPPAPTMPEMMTALASLKSLAPEQTTDPVDRALKLFDVIAERAPTGDGGAGWMDVFKTAIKEFAPTVAPMIEARLAAQTQPAARLTHSPTANVPALSHQPVVAVAASGGAPAAAHISTAENPEMLGMLALLPWLRTQLAMALQKAATHRDPSLCAERIIDDLPDNVDGNDLMEFVAREDWLQQLTKFEPRVGQYTAWFTDMRNAMLEQFAEAMDASQQVGVVTKPAPVSTPSVASAPVDMPQLGVPPT